MDVRLRVPWLLYALLVLLPAGLRPAAGAVTRPPDVPGDHWAASAVVTLIQPDPDLVELFPDGTFRGAEDLAKYDLVKNLDNLTQYLISKGVRFEGATPSATIPYSDVPADHYAAPAIRRMLWMIPEDKHLFAGMRTMTRLDMAVWLYALLKDLPQAKAIKLGPPPRDMDATFARPAQWALAAGEEGLISNYPDGRFHPDRELTRYEMAYSVHQVVRWLTKVQAPQPVVAQDNALPELRVLEPEVEGAKDFVVVARKKQITVVGVAADDTGIAKVSVNNVESTLAFADEADLKKAGLKGPAAVWFRAQVPAPEERGHITITVTDKHGKVVTAKYTIKAPSPEAPQVAHAATQPAGTQRVARKWALLVGVNRYDDVENIPTLRFSVNDAQALYEVLIDPERGGFEKDTVFLLTDNTPDKPTNINIIKYLNRIARRAEPEDMVLFYFSGHGYEEGGRGYVLSCNTDIEALSASAVDNSQIVDTLDRMKAQRIVSIFDACHSGSIKRTGGSGGLSNQFYSAYGGGKGRVFMSSSAAGQKSWEVAQFKHGVFTLFLKRGLMGEADRNRDGAVVFLELAKYVYEGVKDWAKQNGKEQEPMIQTENFAASDIMLALNPAAKPTGPLAEKKRAVYAKLDPEDADYACALLEKPAPNEREKKILQYLDQMVAGKVSPQRYLDFVRLTQPAS